MHKPIKVYLIISIMINAVTAQPKNDAWISTLLKKTTDPITQKVLADPKEYRYQIIYTQIDRDQTGKPTFKNHYLNIDPALYFNPASMVKMPLAFLALEKLNEMKLPGVDKNTRMLFDSSFERQVALTNDSSSESGFPSMAHFIKRAFLISENDPYNRMYQFLGQREINSRLKTKGYSSVRITRQFMGYTDEQNRHTNGIKFLDKKGQIIHQQAPGYNTDSFSFPSPVLIGKAHINRNDSLVQTPFDFTRHNNISLEDMQQMLQAIVFPESVDQKKRFNISALDRSFLLQYLSQYPSETNYPKYDEKIFHDSYVKFFFYDATHRMPDHIRVFNKVGWAYGFLTDVSYVLDTQNNIDFMLSATVYVNSDGVVNDSKYDEESIGFPFLRSIGRSFYEYDLSRERKTKPQLNNPVKQYESRIKGDPRPSIKSVDN
ncbi:MAG: hypothetical protein EBS95_08700 [Chitinophagia bacterium]|nr:hypothetical protein [Chitinophagia bacterium]